VSGIVAVFAAPRADTPEATEFLRVLAALRAVGRTVSLVEAGRGAGVLSQAEPALTEEGERYLDALAEESVVPAAALAFGPDLSGADGLVLLADPARSGVPALLMLAADRSASPVPWATLLSAGQVVLVSSVPSP